METGIESHSPMENYSLPSLVGNIASPTLTEDRRSLYFGLLTSLSFCGYLLRTSMEKPIESLLFGIFFLKAIE
jgi:hypothetical protein